MALPYFVRYVLCPLAIMLGCPTLVLIFSHIIQNLNGSVAMTYNEIKEFGPLQFIAQQCILNNLPTINHFISIFAFYLFQILLYYIVPGKTVHGPPTSTGYVPKYKQNGVATYSISLTFVMIGYFVFGIPFHELINHIAPLSIAILITSLIVTVLLMFCALCCPENPSDVKSSGNWIMDYYSGLELYPYWFGINCKQLINSRIGMTQWALVCLCHICKDYDNMKQLSKTNELLLVSDYVYILSSPVFISGVLQIIYLFKFFWWEIGYFATIDVQHDRCGFMICWGCLCWVFGVYTFHTSTILSNKLFQSQEKNDPHCLTMNGLFACIIFVIGVLSIYINYECDAQKMRVRKSNGNCKIFGKKAEIIRATYVSEAGKNKKSILLVSGYWGFARHFHYVPELMFAFTICVPGITLQTGLQLFYFFFLILLLADRTGRDDDRCSKKYTKYWKLYCKQVKYKMIPYVW